jgi:hypothetical protein
LSESDLNQFKEILETIVYYLGGSSSPIKPFTHFVTFEQVPEDIPKDKCSVDFRFIIESYYAIRRMKVEDFPSIPSIKHTANREGNLLK